jgi:hypothetical protein
MNERDSYSQIKDYVNEIKLIDSHEHLIPEEVRISTKVDLFTTFFQHYASSDLISSGMQRSEFLAMLDRTAPLEERWRNLSPFWENIKHTGYARALEIAARNLYGVEKIEQRTIAQLSAKMAAANRAGLYNWVLREKAGIERCLLDSLDEVEPFVFNHVLRLDVNKSLFAPVTTFEDFVMVNTIQGLRNLSAKVGTPIHSFQDLLQALDLQFGKIQNSIFGVKIALAYFRSLYFEKTDVLEAEKAFNKIFRTQPMDWSPKEISNSVLMYGPSMDEAKPLQDFLVHRVIQLAGRYRLPVQVHTGLQEGNGNVLLNSHPLNLVNLFTEYSDVRFDIFHGSYPYTGELAAIAKNFQNVYVDMCWLHIISSSRARLALSEWLDSVPENKILAFGGDYLFVEGVYGHSIMAREDVARVLSEKVEEKSMTIEEAKAVARKLLRENAIKLFFGKERENDETN